MSGLLPALSEEGVHLPVLRKGEVVAWTLIAREDYERFAGYRWTLSHNGYVWRREGQGGYVRRFYLHREVLGLGPWTQGGLQPDHINRDSLDNRRANLRIVTPAQNAQNQGSRGGSSQHRGVSYLPSSKRWRAYAAGTTLGRFPTEGEAAAVAAAHRASHMPYSAEARLDRRVAAALAGESS